MDVSDSATATARTPVVDRPFGPRFVAPMFIGSALNPINSSVIATALVSIAAAMGVPVGRTSILISSLYLTSAIAQPTAGRLSEEFGPRRVFLVGIVIVLAGGILGGTAQNLPTLVAARVLIGLGTSAGYPSAMLLIRRRATAVGLASPPGSVLGGLAIAGAATVAIGPTIGGLLVGWFNWRAAFLINVPVAAVAFVMALRWIARDPDRISGRPAREVIRRIDLAGVIGFGGTMTALLVFLLALPHPEWIALGASAAVAAALIRWELRAANPFLDIRLLASNLALTRTYVRYGLTLLGTYVILYGLTQWMEAAHGLSAYEAGLILIPMGLLSAAAARVVSRRQAIHRPLIAAAVFMLAGAVATLFLTSHSPVIAIIAVTALFGLTSGSSNVTNQTALYKESPAEKVGTASGLLRTFGYIGSIAASTITGVAFRTHVDDTGLRHVALILIGIGVLVLLMTAFDRHLAASGSESASGSGSGSGESDAS
ncbi:MFS transporter [Streptomyces sp. NBC_01476]|uniref:MFS transporter n=1 Tax=Streptomyces sp. NBC_01476 TaxID=2903881 RepID=UPI002E373CA0|nr:MFS transporter [Streptomyces sp. NBC_01476]